MRFKRLLGAAAATAILGTGLVLVSGSPVSAHHPELSKTETRPCGENQPWTGTVLAESDQDWNKDWRNKHKIGNGSYSSWSGWVDDQEDYGPFSIGTIPANVSSVEVSVSSEWRSKSGSGATASATRSITLNRPRSTDCPSTPVTWTATDGDCASPDGTLALTYDANKATYSGSAAGSYTSGDSVTGSFSAKPGFVLSGDDSPYSHTFATEGAPCTVPGVPASSIDVECGKATLTFSNVVEPLEGYTGEDVTFDYKVDGVAQPQVVVAAGADPVVIVKTFAEDSGPHSVQIGDGDVVEVQSSCEDDEVATGVVTFTDPTCANSSVSVNVPTTEHVTYNIVGDVAPGGSVTVNAVADEGYVLTGTLQWNHDFPALDTLDCTVDANPVSSIGIECGSATFNFSNIVENVPDGYTADDATFTYYVDGNATVVVLEAGETDEVVVEFAEDSGQHTVRIGRGADQNVESNCELEEVTPAAPSFVDPSCASSDVKTTIPSTTGVVYTHTGDETPGGSVTVTATAAAGYVLTGTTQWKHDFPALDTLVCAETLVPTIEVAAFAPVCQVDIPFISYNIEVSGTDEDTATLTFFDLEGNEVAKHEDVALTGKVIYPGASEDPQDWPGWKQNSAGEWVPDPLDDAWRDGLNVEVEVNPTAEGTVEYPEATEACNGPDVTDVGSQGPDPAPPTPVELPKTGSDSTNVLISLGSLLLLGGALLLAAVRRPKHV